MAQQFELLLAMPVSWFLLSCPAVGGFTTAPEKAH